MTMKCFQEIKTEKIREIICRENEFDFPEFLIMLRTTLGLTQKCLSKETGIGDWTFHTWEHGKIIRPPRYELLVTLADYYGISHKLLKQKALDFVRERKKCA